MTLTDEEARQIYEYLRHQYLDRNKWGALSRLLDKIAGKLNVQNELLTKV